MFSKEVSDRLRCYVYRLIDPRNGETFYVGKGVGNRVFAHVNGELSVADEDVVTAKLRRIREIRVDGFEVAHVIHRHGMDDATAFEVEAALIDAYPEATNLAGGRADERGLMHSKQIIERYEAEPAVFHHRVVLININRSVLEQDSVYEAVRYAWKLDHSRAEKAEVVLAVQQGLIIDAFVADRWLRATTQNFPGTADDRPGRWGFVGTHAPEEIRGLYLRHRVPDELRKRGAANPVRYASPTPLREG